MCAVEEIYHGHFGVFTSNKFKSQADLIRNSLLPLQGPRPGEEDGKDYHFSNKEEMMEMMGNNDFIETAEFSGNMYGTSKKSVQDVLDNGNCRMLRQYHK